MRASFFDPAIVFVALLALSLFASSIALGSVRTDPVQKTEGLSAQFWKGMHIGVTPIAGGYYTHGGPDVSVPTQVPNEGWPPTAGSFLIPEVGYPKSGITPMHHRKCVLLI